MKNTVSKALATRIAIVFCALATACTCLSAQTEIHFRLVQNTLIVIAVTVDQAGPFDFVLDTGADTTVLDPSITSRLSLASTDQVHQTTMAGTQTLTRGLVHGLAAGPFQAENLRVLVQDLASLRQLDPHIEGIAGQNFLAHFNYLIDYRRHTVRLETGKEIEDAIRSEHVPVEAVGNRLLVESQAEAQGSVRLRLLVDTGASSIVLVGPAVRALRLPPQESRVAWTSSGETGMHVGRVRQLSVGGEQLTDIVAAIPTVQPRAQIGDGLLPTSLFQSLYINNRDSYVVFNPKLRKN